MAPEHQDFRRQVPGWMWAPWHMRLGSASQPHLHFCVLLLKSGAPLKSIQPCVFRPSCRLLCQWLLPQQFLGSSPPVSGSLFFAHLQCHCLSVLIVAAVAVACTGFFLPVSAHPQAFARSRGEQHKSGSRSLPLPACCLLSPGPGVASPFCFCCGALANSLL